MDLLMHKEVVVKQNLHNSEDFLLAIIAFSLVLAFKSSFEIVNTGVESTTESK